MPIITLFLLLLSGALYAAPNSSSTRLHEGWSMQSSAKVKAEGARISTPSFKPQGWYRTSVPTTVLAALVENKVYPDPYFGMNLASLPGAGYTKFTGVKYPEHNFSNVPMPPDSPFKGSWWFRKEFRAPADYRGCKIWLRFDGINFRANVWLNGRAVTTADKTAGTWRVFEFDVTDAALPGKANVLAVEVFPPQPNDLAISWVDWNPGPPDKNTGLWRDVYLNATGPVRVRWPHVIARFTDASLEEARLTVTAELHNASDRAVKGTLHGEIGGLSFSKEMELPANETTVARLSADDYGQLALRNPRLWWPARLGPQELYDLKLWYETGGAVSDTVETHFGIREVTSELTGTGARVFKINRKNILIRGAGWSPDMLLRVSPQRQEAEVGYALDMNLNTIRLEGKLEDEHFLDLCDRQGILVMAGWSCCDHWEKWDNWKAEDYVISAESLRDQVRRLRTHPSVFDWLNGSDYPPPPKVEETYLRILKELDWPNPYQSSASQAATPLTGASGLKMTGPYEYVPPVYWSTDRNRGGAFGFNTETSPGAAIPTLESLRKFVPPKHLWPVDQFWNFHAGRDVPRDLDVYTKALSERYGASENLDEFVLKSQVIAYEGQRAMFEAFGENKYAATGIIQWMLNSGWPSVVWQLYDYYLRPTGGYFGAKKALEPLHVQYSYKDRSVVVVNSFYKQFEQVAVRAWIYDLNMRERYATRFIQSVPPDSVTRAFVLPPVPEATDTYFVRLALEDPSGKEISSNFYWLSQESDVLDWDKGDAYYTPQSSYADFSELAELPVVRLRASARHEVDEPEGTTRVTLENTSQHLAFFVHLAVANGAEGDEILPVLWEDNYFPLLPGQRRTVTAKYQVRQAGRGSPTVRLDGWNVSRQVLATRPATE
jgi:exo-1,4-beta-D-glucosaminidase